MIRQIRVGVLFFLLPWVPIAAKAVPQSTEGKTARNAVRSAQESSGPSEEVAQDTRPANCRVTLPADGVFEPRSTVFTWPSRTPEHFLFGTAGLFTWLPADGTWRGLVPGKPYEFAYGDKLPWFHTHAPSSEKDGPLTVTGKRLDGPGPSFIETFESIAFHGHDGIAMIMGGISIPVFGCWEIIGHYRDEELAFTVWVTSLAKQEQSSRASSPPPARKTAAHRIQVDAATQAASLVYSVIPELPAGAKTANVSGTVVLHAIIGTNGRVNETGYVSGPQLLAQAAMEAVRWWQYRIALTSLDPSEAEEVEVDTTINVVFPALRD